MASLPPEKQFQYFSERKILDVKYCFFNPFMLDYPVPLTLSSKTSLDPVPGMPSVMQKILKKQLGVN